MIERDCVTLKKMDATLGKEYKLCSKIIIDQLFEKGTVVKQFPFRLLYLEPSKEFKMNKPFQLVIAVPKRNVRKAHDRNRLKRILKELIRKNKEDLEHVLLSKQKQLALFVLYSEKVEIETTILENKLKKVFQQLINQLNNDQA